MFSQEESKKIIQESSKRILAFIDSICKKNGWKYYLAYGTLLGAIRHKGFIPWDDDVDIWMPRDDFMQFLSYLREHNYGMIGLAESEETVIDANPMELQIKVSDKTIDIVHERYISIIESHPWVDVFCLDKFPKNRRTIYIQKVMFKRVYWNMLRFQNTDKVYERIKKRKVKYAIYSINRKFHLATKKNPAIALRKFENELTKYSHIPDNKAQYYSYASVYFQKPKKCVFDIDWFGEPEIIEFDGMKYNAPRNPDAILRTIYGDYMQLPPEEKRIYHHCEILNVHGIKQCAMNKEDIIKSNE